jgi:dihydroxyacetone kinase-like predicted kinase
MAASERDLISLYSGADVSAQAAEALAAAVRAIYPKHDVASHAGGQPYYHYILSVE